MAYLTYDEYTEMGGTADETLFNSYCMEAQGYIDLVTFNRLASDTTIPQSVKNCMYELIRLIIAKRSLMSTDYDETSLIHKMKNDGVEVTYNVVNAKELLEKDIVEIKNTIKLYLNGVENSLGQNVLFRGRYENE